MKLLGAQWMPLAAGVAPELHPEVRQGTLSVDFGESPVFIRLRACAKITFTITYW
jgi:hypothetical protein